MALHQLPLLSQIIIHTRTHRMVARTAPLGKAKVQISWSLRCELCTSQFAQWGVTQGFLVGRVFLYVVESCVCGSMSSN